MAEVSTAESDLRIGENNGQDVGRFGSIALMRAAPRAELEFAIRWRTNRAALTQELSGGSASYRSAFSHWEKRASVRAKPARTRDQERVRDGLLNFPPELFPAATHPIVVSREPRVSSRLLTHRLYDYLRFTIELEQAAVLPITNLISRRRIGLELPEPMLADAFKISTDEAWHAQFSDDLTRQIFADTGVPVWLPQVPQFARRIRGLDALADSDLRSMQALMFAMVSETLISSTLTALPQDRRLPSNVRAVIADHAEDEGRHHAYFRSMLFQVWPALSRSVRMRIGPWLPELIFAFLEPDYRAISFALTEVGLNPAEAEQVLLESYPRAAVTDDVARAARSTVRYFEDVGALRDPETRDRFIAAGLTNPEP